MALSPVDVDAVLRVFDLTGVLGNAIIGGVIAREEKFDIVGFITLAVLSGMGGGIIRDTLLQAGPPVALTDPAYLPTALLGVAISYLLNIGGRRVWVWTWPIVDAIALGAWSTAGALRTLSVGIDWLPAILLGIVTATGGGAMRDALLGRRPGIFGGNTLYATAAAAGAATAVLFSRAGLATTGQLAGLVVGAGLCLLARWRGWILPDADAWSPASALRPLWRRPSQTSGAAKRRAVKRRLLRSRTVPGPGGRGGKREADPPSDAAPTC